MHKISPRPLSAEVADRIRTLIRKDELKSGEKLSEQRLCDLLGVSRTPLREALRVLGAEGLVTLTPNKGAHVAQASITEIREMFEVMSVLEGTCARLAAERMSDADLQELEAMHYQLEQRFAAQDPHGYMSCNNEYHTFVQEKSGNAVLGNLVSGLREVILLHRYRQIHQKGRLGASMHEHRAVVEAFRQRDPDRAEQLMRRHLMNQCEALEAYYAERDEAEAS